MAVQQFGPPPPGPLDRRAEKLGHLVAKFLQGLVVAGQPSCRRASGQGRAAW